MYVVMFACLVASVAYISLDTKTMTNAYNPRTKKSNTSVIRGKIMDYNGNILVESMGKEENHTRDYLYGKEFCHIIGYSGLGNTGVEAQYNFELTKVQFEIIERFKNLIFGSKVEGNSIALTLDKDIQTTAYELLGKRKGSIVVIEPSTGKILAMVSYPNFNPNTINEHWDALKADQENSPLLNRAIQGLYPPGSIYKIVTAAAAMENIANWNELSFDCVGEQNFLDKKIRCYDNTKHGVVNIQQAFAQSCNTTFAQLGKDLGATALKSISERVGFNNTIDFPLEYNKSTFALNEGSTQSELVETAIGQGKTLTTPLQMARITAAVANGGILMKPYLLDHIEDSKGTTLKKFMPEKQAQLFSPEVAQQLVEMMVEVVNTGTGTPAKIKNVEVAGKTGTAEVAGGNPHAWFVGFAPAQNPKVAVVVLLEGGGGGGANASPIAKKIMQAVLDMN